MMNQAREMHIHFHFHIAASNNATTTPETKPPVESCPTRKSFTRMMFDHVKTIIPQANGAECAMRFLSTHNACIAGSAVVKSIARVAAGKFQGRYDGSVYDKAMLSCPSLRGTLERNTDVDFWVPCPIMMSWDPVGYVTGEIKRCFEAAIVGKPVITVSTMKEYTGSDEYTRLHKNVMAIITLTCPDAPDPWTQLQFMVLRPFVTIEDAVCSFDIKALQIALSFKYRQSVTDHASFVTACDVTSDADVISPLKEMQIMMDKQTLDTMTLMELIRSLRRVVKYVRDYGWNVTEEELLRMREAYVLKQATYSKCLCDKWNEVCTDNADVLHSMLMV